MNPSNSQIEGALFGALKVHCPSIKNLSSFNPNITFKDLMTDHSYLDEKLNLFIWAILRYEPRFSSEFVEHQFFPVDVKCKKILEALHMVSLIDITDFGVEKLLSSSERHYREQMHILNDMVKLLKLYQAEQFIPIRRPSPSYDEKLAFDFNSLAMTNSNAAPPAPPMQEDEATLMRKIQVLDDAAFLSDFRRLLQLGALSLLPPEHSRVIKIINENTEYLRDLSLGKSTRREEIMSFVDAKLAAIDLNQPIQDVTAASRGRNQDFVAPKPLELELNNFRADLKQVNESMKTRVSGLTVPFANSSANHLVESNLGRNFDEFSKKKDSLDKLTKCFTDWSLFIETQLTKQTEYGKCEESMMGQTSLVDSGSSFDLSDQLDKYLSLLGEESKKSDAKMADELLF